MTIDEIVEEIVLEVGGDVDDTDFSDKMLKFLKAGMRRVPAFIRDRLFLAQGTLTLAQGSATVDLSTLDPGFIRERGVYYIGDSDIRVPIYKPQSYDYFNRFYAPTATGNPIFYHVIGKTMEFDRKAAANTTIFLDYFKEISSVIGSDTFIGNEQTVEVCKDFCKVVYYGYEEDIGKKDDFEAQGNKLLLQLEADYEAQELGGYVEEKNWNW